LSHKRNTGLFLLIFIVLAVFFVFQSCSLKQTLYIDRNGAGSVSFNLELAPYFADVTEQLSDLSPRESSNNKTDKKKGLFDLAKIKEDFSRSKGTVVEELESPSGDILKGKLTFTNITTALNSGLNSGTSSNIGNIFNFSSNGEERTLSVLLDYNTVEKFLAVNPSMDSPLMQTFGPLANKGLTDSDYLDMMQFALGDESREGIKDSYLILDVNVDGVITAQKGGTLIDTDTVQFKIPLLRILILDEPQSFYVSFRK